MNKSVFLKCSVALNFLFLVSFAVYGYYKRGAIKNIVSTEMGGVTINLQVRMN